MLMIDPPQIANLLSVGQHKLKFLSWEKQIKKCEVIVLLLSKYCFKMLDLSAFILRIWNVITSKLLMSVSCFKHDYANLTTMQAMKWTISNTDIFLFVEVLEQLLPLFLTTWTMTAGFQFTSEIWNHFLDPSEVNFRRIIAGFVQRQETFSSIPIFLITALPDELLSVVFKYFSLKETINKLIHPRSHNLQFMLFLTVFVFLMELNM